MCHWPRDSRTSRRTSGAVGHDAVDAEVEQAVHLARRRRSSTRGPARPSAVGPLDERPVDDRERTFLDRHLGGKARRLAQQAEAQQAPARRGPSAVHSSLPKRRPQPLQPEVAERRDAHPRQRLVRRSAATSASTAASILQSMLTRASGHAPSRSSSERDRRLAVDQGLADLGPRQLADLAGPAARAHADRCRGRPRARRRRSPARRSRGSDSRGRSRTRTPAWCSPAHRWRRLDGRTERSVPVEDTDDEGCSYGKYRRSTWLDTITVRSPFDDSVIGEIPAQTDADVGRGRRHRQGGA